MYTVRAVEDAGPYKMIKKRPVHRTSLFFYFIGQFRKISFAAAS